MWISAEKLFYVIERRIEYIGESRMTRVGAQESETFFKKMGPFDQLTKAKIALESLIDEYPINQPPR